MATAQNTNQLQQEIQQIQKQLEEKQAKLQLIQQTEINKLISKFVDDVEANGFNKVEVKKMVIEKGLEGKVIFAGVLNDVNRYYSAFDYFLFPSLYEGLSIAMIEAQISGLYCFVSNTVDLNTKITDNYSTIDINDESSYIAEMIIKNKKENDRANINYEMKYDIKNSSKKLQNFYERNCKYE